MNGSESFLLPVKIHSGSRKIREMFVVNLKEKSAHLAWCELVALALGRKNGDIVSPVQ